MCRTYQGAYGAACWMEITHAALVKFGNDPKLMFQMCSTAQVLEGQEKCRRHAIGIITAARQFDLPSLVYMCKLKQPKDPGFEADCYENLVASTLVSVPSDLDRTVSLCGSLDSVFQRRCFAQIYYATRGNPSVTADQLRSACGQAPYIFQDACEKGDALNPGVPIPIQESVK